VRQRGPGAFASEEEFEEMGGEDEEDEED